MATSSSSNKVTSSRIVPLNLHSSMTSSWPRLSISSRSRSPNRSKPVSPRKQNGRNKKTCMCSPTTHPGSFRCNFHKNDDNSSRCVSSNRLNARRSAMTNSLVRIITAEGGDLVRRALAALIRPSSHHQRRRSAFEPRPSRLSLMSKADHEL